MRISLYVPRTSVCFDYLLSSSEDFQLNFHGLQRSFLQEMTNEQIHVNMSHFVIETTLQSYLGDKT